MEIKKEKGLVITSYVLNGLRHKPMNIGGFVYKSAADFSVNSGWINHWGSSFDITNDIHGNYIVYWKTRFPLFDSSDYAHDNRHYRIMLLCSSMDDAHDKMAFIQSKKTLHVLDFENNLYSLSEHYSKKEYRRLLPFVCYEDSEKVFSVEVEKKVPNKG